MKPTREVEQQIHVKLSKPLHKALKLRAVRDDKKIKDVVVEALERYLHRKET